MVACKIITVCLTVLAINARQSKSQILGDSNKDCSCFPRDKEGIRISKLADKFGKHDRKVIYLFRYPDTGKVTIFLPNQEKQKHFPDLTVSHHDSYGLPIFERVNQLFEDPKSVVTPFPGANKLHVIDNIKHDFTVPKGPTDVVGVGDAKVFHHHINDPKFDKKPNVFKIKPQSPKHFDVHLGGHKGLDAGDKHKTYVDHGTGDQKFIFEIKKTTPGPVGVVGKPVAQGLHDAHSFPGHKKIILDYINKPLKTIKNKTDIILEHVKPDLYDLNNDNNIVNQPTYGIDVDLGHGDKVLDLSDKKLHHSHPYRPAGNLNLLLGHDHQTPINQHTYIDHDKGEFTIKESEGTPIIDTSSGMETFTPSVLTEPTEEVDEILDITKPSYEIGQNLITTFPALVLGSNDKVIPSSSKVKPPSGPAFDRWLVDEINNIENFNLDVSSPQTNDLKQIKNSLLNVLEQNRLYISDDGDLVDVTGHKIKMSHLKLRKVMISDPTVYKKLLSSGSCVIPHEIPYLEAIFVNLVYPPKILGLIPLKMATLPKCKERKEKKCAGNVCTKPRKVKPLPLNTKTPAKLNLSLRRHTGLSPTTDNGREEPFKIHSDVKSQDVLQIPSVDVHVGDDEESTVDDNDDGLGIRIIGGNPATSSGTPVSSRGRSGTKPSSLFNA